MSSTAPTDAELLPGYFIEPGTGAWLTLPWPTDLAELPPSLFPQLHRWARGQKTSTTPALDGPRLLHHLSGNPWDWTRGQKRWLHYWYAVRTDGRWLYRSGVKRGAKGTGKDPLIGSQCHLEAAGPVVFDGFDRNGRPVGRPHRMALVQIAANSEAQAGDVLRVANGMVSNDLADELGWDPGILRSLLGPSRVELLTSSEASSEGDPATAIFLNESHHMKRSNGGQLLAGVARRNTAKSPNGAARVAEYTNAHLPGESSVAEDSFTAWQLQVAGNTRRKDILYDSREAAPDLRMHIEEELEEGIAQAYADSPWNDKERIRDDAQDPRTPVADSIRYYFNSLPTNELAWVDPRNFDALHQAIEIPAGEPITMFLDCSKSTDSTTLVAARMADGHVFTPERWAWRRPHGDRGTGWLAPREEVDAVVREMMATYAVQWFGVDPSPAKDDETEASYWAPTIDAWHRDYRQSVLIWATPTGKAKSAVCFDMRLSAAGGVDRNKLFTEQAELVAASIDDEHTLTHDGDPILRTHVHNARRRPNQWGVSLGKSTRDSSDLVDGAVSMIGALLGRRIVLQSGKRLKRKSKGKGARVTVYG